MIDLVYRFSAKLDSNLIAFLDISSQLEDDSLGYLVKEFNFI